MVGQVDTSDHKRDTTRVVGLWGLKKTICVRTVKCSRVTGTTTAVQTWKNGFILRVHWGDEALCMTILLSNEIKDVEARCIEQLQYCAVTECGSAGSESVPSCL